MFAYISLQSHEAKSYEAYSYLDYSSIVLNWRSLHIHQSSEFAQALRGLTYTDAMPRLDFIHNAVKNSLSKDGWSVTDDPYVIEYRKTKLYADLGAERPIAAERAGHKIVVEVKSFIGASKLQDLKEALGQYDIYRYLLEETAPDRKLYVAVSVIAYKSFFNQDVIQLIVNKHQLPLIVVDTELEEIVQWIN